MDEELKTHLIAMESRINARLGGIETGFGGIETRIDGIGTRIDGIEARIEGIETRIEGLEARIGATEGRLNERIEKVENTLRREFSQWGRTSEMRTRQTITDVGFLGERVLNMEDRITALEHRRRAS